MPEKRVKFVDEAGCEQEAILCECPLEVLDLSYRNLNRLVKWLAACVVCIAAHCGCTLPTKPDTGGQFVVTKSAGWGNGNKA
jgi:hypothetical protein